VTPTERVEMFARELAERTDMSGRTEAAGRVSSEASN
jgi:hypothetical protein